MVAVSFQRIPALLTHSIDFQVLLGKVPFGNQLGNIGIVAAGQPPVGGNDDYPFLPPAPPSRSGG